MSCITYKNYKVNPIFVINKNRLGVHARVCTCSTVHTLGTLQPGPQVLEFTHVHRTQCLTYIYTILIRDYNRFYDV